MNNTLKMVRNKIDNKNWVYYKKFGGVGHDI
jgi:hypothetical protein